jgi:hypothetical protein
MIPALTKSVEIEIDPATWTSSPPPAALTGAVGSYALDVSASLLFTALWTRPPVTFGFSLSDTWAWMRYLPALCSSSELRLCDEWTSLPTHQKTILSDDWGVGFTTWFLSQTLGFIRYADTAWVLKNLAPGSLILGPSKKRGPAKSPDYIAEDAGGNLSVVECKGTQSSRRSLRGAVDGGIPQKTNLKQGTTPVVHSLVAGLFVPQFDNTATPLLLVVDPEEQDGLRSEVFRFNRDEVRRSVTQVALAKELSLLQMPETAAFLAGEKERRGIIGRAVAADRDRPRTDRTEVADGLVVNREYVWERPTRVAEDHTLVGLRFQALLPASELETLINAPNGDALAERRQDARRATEWHADSASFRTTLTSPFGTRLTLELLEA